MKRNGLPVTEEINKVMEEQESKGETAVMCAIDGKKMTLVVAQQTTV